ncbi:sigma-70 family RNA polymerase sigma factor [Pedobacter frigoris]|uniref:RNA polymerase sigma factor n=1 Tax=Pedobacter frigoris TaxID=2571272 RepID=UPI0029311D5D|nr:sigma-70 family RNA polymerase sigma factor [Pedobacter frigoris]
MDTLKQKEQFVSVIEQNKGIIYKIANSFNRDEEDRKDLVQEIIFQLWRSFPGYDSRSKFTTWMYRVALNVAITSYRKERKKTALISPISENVIALLEDDVPIDNEVNLKLLQQFINELKELDRALMLLYLEEKSQKEMAEILGLSETNIGTKVSRIKEKLKQRFLSISNN